MIMLEVKSMIKIEAKLVIKFKIIRIKMEVESMIKM